MNDVKMENGNQMVGGTNTKHMQKQCVCQTEAVSGSHRAGAGFLKGKERSRKDFAQRRAIIRSTDRTKDWRGITHA